jgi:hypothetical protein
MTDLAEALLKFPEELKKISSHPVSLEVFMGMCVYFPSSHFRVFCVKLTAGVDIFRNYLLSLLKILESKINIILILNSEAEGLGRLRKYRLPIFLAF